MKQYGTVKWYSDKRGFGFIAGDDGEDYFVHYQNIAGDGYRFLRGKHRVEFEIGTNDQGRTMAVNVVKLDGPE